VDSAAAALGTATITDASQEATATSTTSTPANDSSTAAPTTGGEWDDEALAASYARKGAPGAAGATAELLDMKAFDAKRRDQDDIVERMRVEETKAQLAAAKAGMEREAARLKEERENKDFVAVKKPEPSRGLGAFGGGSKWVPPHMRAGGGVEVSRSRMGALGSQKLDTQDENLFPDLAAADAILEKKKEDIAYKVHKKTPVGGGATWGSRPPVNIRPPVVVKPKEPEPVPEPKAPEPEPTPAPEPAPAVSAAPVMKKKPTKKKKKDLSTFNVKK
jgi:hypothetical protein